MTADTADHPPKELFVATIRNPTLENTAAVTIGEPADISICLANISKRTFRLNGRGAPAPAIVIDFTRASSSPPEIDPASVRCSGFDVRTEGPGVIVLTPKPGQHFWFVGQDVTIALPALSLSGDPGYGFVDIALKAVEPNTTWSVSALVVRLDKESGTMKVEVAGQRPKPTRLIQGGPAPEAMALDIGFQQDTAGNGDRPEALLVNILTAGNGGLRAVTSPALGRAAEVSCEGWRSERIPEASTPLWRLTPDGGAPGASARILVNDLRAEAARGTGHIEVYAIGKGRKVCSASATAITVDSGTPGITSFTADPVTPLPQSASPRTVHLSWTTNDVAFLTLSGVGTVPTTASKYAVEIEATTTFVLTAYDTSLLPIASSNCTVTVAVVPDPLSELVTTGTIVPWGGLPASVPTGWLICDGSEHKISDYPSLGALLGSTYGGDGQTTFNVPDLGDRFVLGAATRSAEAAQTSGGPDTHDHTINNLTTAQTTTGSAGSHSHLMPADWYARNYSSSTDGYGPSIATPGYTKNSTRTQDAGAHTHTIAATKFNDATSGSTTAATDLMRPPRLALCHIIKT